MLSFATVRSALLQLMGGAITPYPAPVGFVGRTRIGLVTVIDEEFDAAKEAFQLPINISGTPYFAEVNSRARDWDIVLAQAPDRSNVPFSGEVSNFIQDLRPQVLILIGVAGGLCRPDGCGRDGIDLGHVIIADYVGYVEFLKITAAGVFHRHYAIDHPSLPLRRSASLPLQKEFDLAAAVTVPMPMLPLNPTRTIIPRVHIGPIVSAEKVMGDVHDPVQKQLLAPFDNSLAVDMESIGMARQICERRNSFWYHPRYVVIRGISDLVGPPENDQIRAAWKAFAAHAAAIVAKEFVRRLPRDPAPG